MLPGIDGLTILWTLRPSGARLAALLLTELDEIPDRVEGFDADGDDYLVNPFAFADRLLRVNPLACRTAPQEVRTELSLADIKTDLLLRSA